MRNRSVTYLPEATFQALADPTRRAVLDLLRQGSQPAGQIAEAFPFRVRRFPSTCANCGKRGWWWNRAADATASINSMPSRSRRSTRGSNEYRQFWQMNLSSLKSFVEEEYARELGEVTNQGHQKSQINLRRKSMKLIRKLPLSPHSRRPSSSPPVLLRRVGRAQTFDHAERTGREAGLEEPQGQPLEVTFRMTAGGSALMSEIHGHGPENMITMFHMDGDRLLMTHYCGAGNQPRMKVISVGRKVSQLRILRWHQHWSRRRTHAARDFHAARRRSSGRRVGLPRSWQGNERAVHARAGEVDVEDEPSVETRLAASLTPE